MGEGLHHLCASGSGFHREWVAPTWGLGSSSAFSDGAALAQGLAELGEVILPAPAHPPNPGPDVVPARADLCSFL